MKRTKQGLLNDYRASLALAIKRFHANRWLTERQRAVKSRREAWL